MFLSSFVLFSDLCLEREWEKGRGERETAWTISERTGRNPQTRYVGTHLRVGSKWRFGPYHPNMMDERRAGRHLGIPKSLTSSSYIALKIDTDIYILTLSRSLVKLLLSLTLVPTLTDGAESWRSSRDMAPQRYSLKSRSGFRST